MLVAAAAFRVERAPVGFRLAVLPAVTIDVQLRLFILDGYGFDINLIQ